MSNIIQIKYPYLPEGREIKFVNLNHPWMQAAKKTCDQHSACSWWPTGAVVVKNNQIIGAGANSGVFQPVCPRVEHQCESGTGYHFCQEKCQQIGHSEITSIDNALTLGQDPQGADLYLYGHWWCCEPCWNHMIKHGIANVYLLKNAHLIFTKENRQALSDRLAKQHQQGERVTAQDAIWSIE
jgi:deoxycytidylate deaminase